METTGYGKGSKYRPYNTLTFGANFDDINFDNLIDKSDKKSYDGSRRLRKKPITKNKRKKKQ